MPSQQYFEELTRAVLTDVDQVKGFSQRQSPGQLQQFTQDISERITETFTKLLEAEMEEAGKLHELHEKLAEVRQAVEGSGAAEANRAIQRVEEWVQTALPAYDAFLLKAGLRIRKAFVESLTKA
jgi:tyrosyl-tRNA synthetase